MERPASTVALVLGPLALLSVIGACPGNPPPGESATDPTTATTTTTTTTPTSGTTSVTTTDTGGIPPEACVDPPPPPPPTPVPAFENTDPPDDVMPAEVIVLSQMMDDPCPKTAGLFNPIPDELMVQIYRPAQNGGTYPPGNFDLVVFSHGNGQDGQFYGPFLRSLARRGYIIATIFMDGNVGPGSVVRERRLLCVAEALLDENKVWTGTGRLTGRYALAGHSVGGYGAFIAAAAVIDNPALLDPHELVAVTTLAPNEILQNNPLSLSPDAPPYFVLQGTGDGDTIGAAFSHYDRVLASIGSNGVVTAAPRSALVWAYDVEHSSYGGNGCATLKGEALASTYVGGFLDAAFHLDPDSLALFFQSSSPQIPAALANPVFWLDYGGTPQIYGTSRREVRPSAGFEALVIDGFENGDEMTADSGLAFQPSNPTMYQESLVGPLFGTSHRTRAAVVGWQDGETLAWSLDLDTRVVLAGATTLTFRAGAVAEIVDIAQCMGSVGELPSLELVLESGGVPFPALDLAPYGRMALPETRIEDACADVQGPIGCRNWDVMQTTFRVPLADLCALSPDFSLSVVDRMTLRFGGTSGVFLVDDLTIHTVPGEPDVACRCTSTP